MSCMRVRRVNCKLIMHFRTVTMSLSEFRVVQTHLADHKNHRKQHLITGEQLHTYNIKVILLFSLILIKLITEG